MLIQDLHKDLGPLQKGMVYYRVISVMNDFSLTEREIQLLAYTNKRGTISSITAKREFVRLFDSSIPTINNMIGKLKKRKLLMKYNTKIVVNPKISLDFTQEVTILLRLNNIRDEGEKTKDR